MVPGGGDGSSLSQSQKGLNVCNPLVPALRVSGYSAVMRYSPVSAPPWTDGLGLDPSFIADLMGNTVPLSKLIVEVTPQLLVVPRVRSWVA